MSEWSNEHAWKACIPRGIMGSNPIPSTIFLKENQRIIFLSTLLLVAVRIKFSGIK